MKRTLYRERSGRNAKAERSGAYVNGKWLLSGAPNRDKAGESRSVCPARLRQVRLL